jgi:hypothetical protein
MWRGLGFVVAAGGVLLAWYAWTQPPPFLISLLNIPIEANQRGVWGDSFGAFNALFSALAFCVVMFTLWTQQQQIRAAQRDQHLQRFEDTFFRLLDHLHQLRQAVRTSTQKEGLLAFSAIIQRISSQELDLIYSLDSDPKSAIVKLRNLYDSMVLTDKRIRVGPYFRIIYNILDRIREDPILTQGMRYSYSRILRAQLNDDEVLLLGLNGLLTVSKDLPELITLFGMLKYIPDTTIAKILREYYPSDAFGVTDKARQMRWTARVRSIAQHFRREPHAEA